MTRLHHLYIYHVVGKSVNEFHLGSTTCLTDAENAEHLVRHQLSLTLPPEVLANTKVKLTSTGEGFDDDNLDLAIATILSNPL